MKETSVDCILIEGIWETELRNNVICNNVVANNFNLYKCKSGTKARFTWKKSSSGVLLYKKYSPSSLKYSIYRIEEGGFSFTEPANFPHFIYDFLAMSLADLFDLGEREIRCDLYMELL